MFGIDVSKDKLDAALADSNTRKRIWSKKVTNDEAGIKILLDNIDSKIPWVVEPTGRYSSLVVKLAKEAKRTVLLAPNRAANLFLKSTSPRAKTDPIDGFGLALFGLSRELRPFLLKSEPVEHLDQLLTARKNLSQTLQRTRLQQSELTFASDVFDKVIETLEEKIEDTDKRIKSQTASDPAFEIVKRLQQVPGIGPVIGAAVGSRLAGKDFKHADSFVAYIGLDVAVRQSGKSEGRRKLTKQGEAELRRLFYVASMAAIRVKDSVFKAEYDRLKARGRSSTEALNIIARKLAHVCWGMHKHGGPFDPAKVYAPRKDQEAAPKAPEASRDASEGES